MLTTILRRLVFFVFLFAFHRKQLFDRHSELFIKQSSQQHRTRLYNGLGRANFTYGCVKHVLKRKKKEKKDGTVSVSVSTCLYGDFFPMKWSSYASLTDWTKRWRGEGEGEREKERGLNH